MESNYRLELTGLMTHIKLVLSMAFNSMIWFWTVDFGDHSFVTCLSNKKIHVVKRDRSHPPEVEQANNPNVPSYIG
jgi:hypothetical protein